MSSLALYRKYRSKDFSEIVGQDHITNVLSQAVKTGKISHAYLFTGPRGVGKTSVARILAREINRLPNDKESHLDIIEIDAASNRRIDEIRELREKVHIAPVELKYKVYIIDEVHMLTNEAFNALLKTLEEPPQHCVFVLATTELHKVPQTIISRTQRHNFQLVGSKLVVKHLADIAKKEKIKIDKESLELIAEHSGGSFRDAIGLLDQFSSFDKEIDKSTVVETLGLAEETTVTKILECLDNSDKQELLDTLDKVYAAGVSPSNLALQLSSSLLDSARSNDANQNYLNLASQLIDATNSDYSEVKIEIALLKNLKSIAPQGEGSFNLRAKASETKTAKHTAASAVKLATKKLTASDKSLSKSAAKEVKPETASKSTASAFGKASVIDEGCRSEILNSIKSTNSALYGLMRKANIVLDGSKAIVEFNFAFHGRRANDKKNKTIIKDSLVKSIPEVEEIEIIVNKLAETTPVKEDMVNDPAKSIIDTFGGGEVIDYGR